MGYLYLSLSKIFSIGKMVAVKKCGNIATGTKNSVIINLFRSLGCIAVSVIVCLISGFDAMDSQGFWLSALSGIANGILLCTWILAANNAPMSTVEVFCMIGGVVLPLIISPIFLEGDSVSLIQWIGSLLLFAAMFCLSKKGGGAKLTPRGIFLLIICGLSNAGCVISQKMFVSFSQGSVADFQLLTYVFCAVTLSVLLLFMQLFIKSEAEESRKITRTAIIYIAVAVVLMYLSQLLSTIASGKLSSAVFYPLSYVIAMPLVFLVDVILFKEKITPTSIIGIILVVISGILINI